MIAFSFAPSDFPDRVTLSALSACFTIRFATVPSHSSGMGSYFQRPFTGVTAPARAFSIQFRPQLICAGSNGFRPLCIVTNGQERNFEDGDLFCDTSVRMMILVGRRHDKPKRFF
jgi:hypothetical protein